MQACAQRLEVALLESPSGSADDVALRVLALRRAERSQAQLGRWGMA
jgi:hypothetical protein